MYNRAVSDQSVHRCDAMVLGKLPVPGRPAIWITVGQGPTALAVVRGEGGGLDIFSLYYPFSPLSPSLWETARYRLKYCLKGPLNPKQPTNQNQFAKQSAVCWTDPNQEPRDAQTDLSLGSLFFM